MISGELSVANARRLPFPGFVANELLFHLRGLDAAFKEPDFETRSLRGSLNCGDWLEWDGVEAVGPDSNEESIARAVWCWAMIT